MAFPLSAEREKEEKAGSRVIFEWTEICLEMKSGRRQWDCSFTFAKLTFIYAHAHAF